MSYLSTTILTAARAVPIARRYSDRKVWIDDVHAELLRSGVVSRMTLETFKRAIASDIDCRFLMVPMCLTQCVTQERIVASSTSPGGMDGVVWNFVKIP